MIRTGTKTHYVNGYNRPSLRGIKTLPQHIKEIPLTTSVCLLSRGIINDINNLINPVEDRVVLKAQGNPK